MWVSPGSLILLVILLLDVPHFSQEKLDINGKKFLEMDNCDDLFLEPKEEKTLQRYQEMLVKYEKEFSRKPKPHQNLEKAEAVQQELKKGDPIQKTKTTKTCADSNGIVGTEKEEIPLKKSVQHEIKAKFVKEPINEKKEPYSDSDSSEDVTKATVFKKKETKKAKDGGKNQGEEENYMEKKKKGRNSIAKENPRSEDRKRNDEGFEDKKGNDESSEDERTTKRKADGKKDIKKSIPNTKDSEKQKNKGGKALPTKQQDQVKDKAERKTSKKVLEQATEGLRKNVVLLKPSDVKKSGSSNSSSPRNKTIKADWKGKESLDISNKKQKKLKDGPSDSDSEIITKEIFTELKTSSEITLRIMDDQENSDKEKRTFFSTFTINRNSALRKEENIYLPDTQKIVSRKHAVVALLEGFGYFLQDQKSSHHTYIRIRETDTIVVIPGMEFAFGNSTFKIERIEKNKILKITARPNDILNCDEPVSLSINVEKRVLFGQGPSSENPSDVCVIFNEDQNIELTHVELRRETRNIILEPRKTTYGTWLKLGSKESCSDFYLLKKGAEFRIGNFRFYVEETIKKKLRELPMCECGTNEFIETIFVPCYHAELCLKCATKAKKCGKKKCLSTEFYKLINPYF